MSPRACTRVGCLRIPWFPIDALRRAAPGETASPLALVVGRGSHARVGPACPSARRRGLRPGMALARARALAPDVALVPWDEAVDAALDAALAALAPALARASPRWTVAEPGVVWLEPVAPLGTRGARALAEAEGAWGRALVAEVAALGLSGGRVGVADGVVAAAAATRVGGRPVVRVPPGGDRAFLGRLPLDALPLDARTRALLAELGLRRLAALQALDPGELEARFGAAGRAAWRLARGEDPRRPRTPAEGPPTRAAVPLAAPCEGLEPVLFVLRGALDRLLAGLAPRGLAVARLDVALERGRAAPSRLEVSPSRPSAASALLWPLLRLELDALSETSPEAAEPVTGVVVEAGRTAPLAPRQGDLLAAAWRDPTAVEAALARLSARLGPDAVAVPEARDAARPDGAGAWRPVARGGAEAEPAPAPFDPPACVRLRDPPEVVLRREEGRVVLAGRTVPVVAWLGPERLSGGWWDGAWDRDYHWAATRDGRLVRLFRDRRTGAWFLDGWSD